MDLDVVNLTVPNQDIAKKVLGEERVKDGFANVIYDLLIAGINAQHPTI